MLRHLFFSAKWRRVDTFPTHLKLRFFFSLPGASDAALPWNFFHVALCFFSSRLSFLRPSYIFFSSMLPLFLPRQRQLSFLRHVPKTTPSTATSLPFTTGWKRSFLSPNPPFPVLLLFPGFLRP